MSTRIPIRNIYYLLSYAFEFTGKGEEDFLSKDTFDDAGELLARILDICLTVMKRRGFAKSYEVNKEQIKCVKGKILLSESLKSGSFLKGMAVCEYDEYTFDSKLNQILKSAVRLILRDKGISKSSVMALQNHLAYFSEVSDIKISFREIDSVVLSSHTKHYRFPLELAKIILQNQTLSNSASESRFVNFLNDGVQMHRVFESFVRKFYARHLDCVVKSENYEWTVQSEDTLFVQRVPILKTDVSIISDNKVLLIETKYYPEALTARFDSRKYRRDHLSQLMEYIRAARKKHGKEVHGILLYPTVTEAIQDTGVLEGMGISVVTIDLMQDWKRIEEGLLGIVNLKSDGQKSAS